MSQDIPSGAGIAGAFSVLDCGGFALDLSWPQVMGVVNVTPDSFSDGGRYSEPQLAIERAVALVEAGAGIIDIGGESTRPGAEPVSIDEEIHRVVPVIEAVRRRCAVPISIDTSKAEVMRAAVEAGAGLINDVRALNEPGALEAASECGVPVCLMHMEGEPPTMQQSPQYNNVVMEVRNFLAKRVAACVASGIQRERILIDPGFGFGKSLEHNLQLLRGLPALHEMGLPILVGLSRKSMIAEILGKPIGERLIGSVTLAALAAWLGAAVIRVHDVAETVEAIKIVTAVKGH